MASVAPDMLSPEFAADPYSAYRLMLDDFPLIRQESSGSYLISRYEDVQRAFRDPVFTTDNYEWQLEPVHGRTILQMSGREHAVHRALVAPAFRGNDLQEKFLPVIERNSRELIDRFRGRGTVDLVAEFSTWLPINVIADMLGLDRSDHDRFHAWYTAIIAVFGNLAGDPEVMAAGERTRQELGDYLIPIIQERRADHGDDLLSTLCAAEIDGTKMTDDDIRAFCSLLLAAGGETSDRAISSLFKNLLEHPDQLDAVRHDRALIPKAFAETLRYTPPVHMVIRQVAEDVALSGGTVPAGGTVVCAVGAANRDPRRYARPDEFDIFRDDLAASTAFSAAADHLAFSLGRHFCVGAMLAKTEVEVATNQLLDAMDALAFQDDVAPREQGLFTRGLVTLPLAFQPADGRSAAPEEQAATG
jgi:cytochrome P450